jgi:hypothetical protein
VEEEDLVVVVVVDHLEVAEEDMVVVGYRVSVVVPHASLF